MNGLRASGSSRPHGARLRRGGFATVPALIVFASALCLVACSSAPGAAPGALLVPAPMPAVSTAAPDTASPTPVAQAELSACAALPENPPLSPLPQAGDMPGGSIMRLIQQRGYLLAGVDQDEYDYGFRNPAPGTVAPGQEFEGYDIDILRAVVHAIFGGTGNPDTDIRFVPVNQDYRMGEANQGVVDLVADSITVTCARAQQVGFSADYFDAHQELLVNRTDTAARVVLDAHHVARIVGLEHKKVCTVGGTTSIENLTIHQKQGGFTTVLAENWSDCLLMLQQGEVQAVTTDDNLLGGLKAEDPYLKVVGDALSDEAHALAVPRSYPGLSPEVRQYLRFINGVLAQLESPAAGWCPEQRLSTDASCWAALYRVWIEPGLGTKPPTPPSLLSYP